MTQLFDTAEPTRSAVHPSPMGVDTLRATLLHRWVPTWWRLFHRPDGGFHERLHVNGEADPAPPRRLLTQCRQLYVHAYATQLGCGPAPHVLLHELEVLQQRYHVAETGGWRFSLHPDHRVADATYDLYGHAFVLLALATLHRATGADAARTLALDTLHFLRTHMRAEVGYHEQLNVALQPLPRIRRQNPHMHLFEGCLAWPDEPFRTEADFLYSLFKQHFFDAETDTVVEYLTEDLGAPHPAEGHLLEPGHHAEWAWLLHRYGVQRPKLKATPRLVGQRLVAWTQRHVRTRAFGANLMNRHTGIILNAHQRIWHLTEDLRAHLALDLHLGVPSMLQQLHAFMRADGTWWEVLDADLQPVQKWMPGTTPYHLMGLLDVLP